LRKPCKSEEEKSEFFTLRARLETVPPAATELYLAYRNLESQTHLEACPHGEN